MYSVSDQFALLPALLLALFGCAVLLLQFTSSRARSPLTFLTVAGILFAGFALFRQHQYLEASSGQPLLALGGSIIIDRLSLFFNAIFLAAAALVALAAPSGLESEESSRGDFLGLLLLGTCGMFFLATGQDLIVLIAGLELMALSFYVLVGWTRNRQRSNEAAIKYLLLGAFSTAFLLYGFSLLYGIAGSTLLADIAPAVAARGSSDPLVIGAVGTCSIGLLFKVAAVPFHMWAPDAYEGAPTPVTAFLAAGSKAASVALLLRVLTGPLAPARGVWEPIVLVAALASLTVGNLGALTQDNVKRLLAWSSVGHIGYVLLGLYAGNENGLTAIAVYVLVYTFMTLGAFLVVSSIGASGSTGERLEDLRGLSRRSPLRAVLMLVFLLSLAGIPPTAGFVGKYFVFLSLVQAGHHWVAMIGLLYVAVSLYYYFRIVRVMFSAEEVELPAPAGGMAFRFALLFCGVVTIGAGLVPEPFLKLASIFPL